jgi:hypothetical protein
VNSGKEQPQTGDRYDENRPYSIFLCKGVSFVTIKLRDWKDKLAELSKIFP